MMTRLLQLLRVACLLMLLTPTASLLFSSTEESEVRAISNPHCSRLSEDNSILTAHGCDHHLLLSPHRIIVDHKATQPDTLIGVTTKKILSVPVPVYHFRQPARISEKQLPFQLVLLSNIDDKTGLIEISVPHSQSIDSWFPGYQWAPIVYVSCGNPLHVGWKFSSTTGDFFYALIVATSEKEKAAAARVGIGTIGESVAEILYIGTRAPLWMIDTLTRIV